MGDRCVEQQEGQVHTCLTHTHTQLPGEATQIEDKVSCGWEQIIQITGLTGSAQRYFLR